LVTTLLDPKRYPQSKTRSALSSALASDVNFKHLKTTLNMEMIWAKSPQMVRKEIWMQSTGLQFAAKFDVTSAELAQVPPMRISYALGNVESLHTPPWRQLPRSVCVSTAYS